jgi:hypothetical protein
MKLFSYEKLSFLLVLVLSVVTVVATTGFIKSRFLSKRVEYLECQLFRLSAYCPEYKQFISYVDSYPEAEIVFKNDTAWLHAQTKQVLTIFDSCLCDD